MSRPAIRVDNLSKCYRIGRKRANRNLTETLGHGLRSAWGKLRQLADPTAADPDRDEFWALKDVSFEVQPGEVVGVIGRNGAGKSTLLKVLSQIVEPTSGYAEIDGRVGSLLEVGTGFHPELTGRENVYLNGSVLGMSRKEIDRQFDAIVEFSGVEQFLDTPVKRYSSGMSVRLGFAVAAHLQTEVLIVDEVLAVGDYEFQRKCVEKMGQVGRSGSTVIVVSHNLAIVENLCTTAIVLEKGRCSGSGDVSDQVASYLHRSTQCHSGTVDLISLPRPGVNKHAVLTKLEVFNDGTPSFYSRMGDPMLLRLSYSLPKPVAELKIGIVLEDAHGVRVTAISPTYQHPSLLIDPPQNGVITAILPRHNLVSGQYYFSVYAEAQGFYEAVERAAVLEVVASDVFGTGRTLDARIAATYQACEWSIASRGVSTWE